MSLKMHETCCPSHSTADLASTTLSSSLANHIDAVCDVQSFVTLKQSCVHLGIQPLPSYLYPGPSVNIFSSTDGQNHTISCSQIKLQTRVGPAPAWFQQAALDPDSYNFNYCTCAGAYHLQVGLVFAGATVHLDRQS